MAKRSLTTDSQPTIELEAVGVKRRHRKVKVLGRLRLVCRRKAPPFILVVDTPTWLITLTSRCRLPYAEAAICGLDVNPLSPPVISSDS